jgi:hypothetical protein
LVNTDELDDAVFWAERRVLEIQTKLHRWASDDPHRRFDDLYNLVTDPGFLLVAWDRVRNNKGARTAGVDGETAYHIESVRGLDGFLAELRDDLRARTFQPLPGTATRDPQGGREGPLFGDRDHPGPGGPGILEAGVGAYLRGGLPPVFLRVPPEPPGSRRGGGGAPFRVPLV